MEGTSSEYRNKGNRLSYQSCIVLDLFSNNLRNLSSLPRKMYEVTFSMKYSWVQLYFPSTKFLCTLL